MAKLILGHTGHDSIKIWVRGSSRWPIAFIDVLDSANRRTRPTKSITLEEEDYFTGVITWGGLRPNQSYRAKVAFGKTPQDHEWERIREAYTEGRFTTFPAPTTNRNFTFLLGSCNLHSLGPVKNPDKAWARVSHISKSNEANFMIHCGDQIYADIPFSPKPDPDHYRRKYLDAWEDCRTAQKLLTEIPHYMILDDHEVDNNFDNDVESKSEDYDSLCRVAMKVYYEFQHKHNPDTPPTPRKYHYTFNYGRCHFFVMDTRFRRYSGRGQMIDSNQLGELLNWLTTYSSNLKFIVSSVPFVGHVKNSKKDKWCDQVFSAQREIILHYMWENDIRKVVFLTGDMHQSYYANMTISKDNKSIKIHELMSSPINQFTPDVLLEDIYDSPHIEDTERGLRIRSTINSRTFYGNHSNIMAIDVNGDRIRYRIYRTSKEVGVAKSGSFQA